MSIVLARFRFPTLLLVFVAGAWLTRSAGPLTSSPRVEESVGARQTTPANNQAAGAAAAHAQCATCHKWPPPDILPRDRWRDEIARMFLIQNNQPEPSGPPGTAGRMVRLPLDWQSIVGYYEANAPEQLAALAARIGRHRIRRLVPEARRVDCEPSDQPGGGEHSTRRSGPRWTARDGVERYAQRHRV